mgnify:CR=1 FL=1
MKRILILLCVLINASAYAQHNFLITENAKVIWQKVYETSYDIEDLHAAIFNSGQYNDIAVYDNTITCWMNESSIDYAQEGYNSSQISMLLRDSNVKGFITIQLKDNRYRVTIEQIQFIAKYDGSFSRKGDISIIETSALNRKGSFNKMVESNTLVVIDAAFLRRFAFKQASHLNDEW